MSIEAIVPFALLPILTRLLEPEEYGIWIMFVSLYSFLRPMINLTLQDAVRSKFFELEAQALARYFWSSLAVSTLITVLFLVTLPFYGSTLARLFHFPGEWLWAAIVVAFLYGAFYSVLAVLQFRGDLKRFVSLQLIHAGSGVLLVGVLLLVGLAWQGVILARISALSLTLIGAWWVARSSAVFGRPSRSVSWDTIRELAGFGMTYLPTGVGVVLLPLMNRVFLSHFSGMGEVGRYGVGALFGDGLGLMVNGYIFAWQPLLFRAVKSEATSAEKHEALSYAAYFSVLLPGAGAGLAFVVYLLLPFLVGPQFQDAFPVIAWMVAAMVCQGYFEQNQAVLLSRRKVFSMSLSYAFVLVVNTVLNLEWIPREGSIGSAKATCASYCIAAAANGLMALQLLRNVPVTRRLR